MFKDLKVLLIRLTLIFGALLAGVTHAEQNDTSEPIVRHMSLTHHDFEDWTFTPKVNDMVLITNRSDIAHSIYVTYPDGSVVNLGVQLPNATVTWVIPTAGDFLLQCWIHPIIKAEMTVSP